MSLKAVLRQERNNTLLDSILKFQSITTIGIKTILCGKNQNEVPRPTNALFTSSKAFIDPSRTTLNRCTFTGERHNVHYPERHTQESRKRLLTCLVRPDPPHIQQSRKCTRYLSHAVSERQLEHRPFNIRTYNWTAHHNLNFGINQLTNATVETVRRCRPPRASSQVEVS
jgi:hypothetical protein